MIDRVTSWIDYEDDYEMSDTGLVRRRTMANGNPIGRLLSPLVKNGHIKYYVTKSNGKRGFVILSKELKKVHCIDKSFDNQWCDAVRKYVNEYNGAKFGMSSKQWDERDQFPTMWDWRSYTCPWLTFEIDCANEDTITAAQLCPLV